MLPNNGMGSLQAAFGPNKANAKVILYVIPVFIIVGLVLISRLPVGGILMLLIAAGLFGGYLLQMQVRVEVYEKGLAARDWLGRRSAFHWDEVSEVYEFIGYDMRRAGLGWHPNQWFYTAHLKDGRRVKLDMAYEKIRNLGFTLQKETGRLLLPAALAALRSGGTITFGDQIGLSARGLVSGGTTLAWTEMEKLRFTRTADLSVHKKGQGIPWKLVMHRSIANFTVFQTLLHEAVKGTPAEGVLEDPFERLQPQGGRPVANIGTVSAAIGTDARDLLMEGFTMEEIQRIVKGEITLEDLKRAGPGSKK